MPDTLKTFSFREGVLFFKFQKTPLLVSKKGFCLTFQISLCINHEKCKRRIKINKIKRISWKKDRLKRCKRCVKSNHAGMIDKQVSGGFSSHLLSQFPFPSISLQCLHCLHRLQCLMVWKTADDHPSTWRPAQKR